MKTYFVVTPEKINHQIAWRQQINKNKIITSLIHIK
jgi:hypothetical protein